MSGLLIKTIDELTPIGDGLFNGTCLFAISYSAVTLNVTAAVLLGWIESNLDLSNIAYDPTGDTIVTATDLLAVIKELDAAIATGTNPFDQDLNTFNSPTFSAVSVTNNIDAQSFSGRGGLVTGTPAHSAAVDPGPGD